MAIKITSFGGTDWANGNILDADDLIDTISYANTLLNQIYTGVGFDSTVSGSSQTDEQSHELTAVSATTRKFVKITITGTLDGTTIDDRPGARVFFKIQSKEIGGGYSDSLAETTILNLGADGGRRELLDGVAFSFTHIHTLTAGEKTNGFQIKVFSKSSTGTDAGNNASFTNIETVLEVIGG